MSFSPDVLPAHGPLYQLGFPMYWSSASLTFSIISVCFPSTALYIFILHSLPCLAHLCLLDFTLQFLEVFHHTSEFFKNSSKSQSLGDLIQGLCILDEMCCGSQGICVLEFYCVWVRGQPSGLSSFFIPGIWGLSSGCQISGKHLLAEPLCKPSFYLCLGLESGIR